MSALTNKQRGLRISLLDMATLLYHVHRGAQHSEVGFEDCERTLRELTEELAPKRTVVELSALESALWSANLMDEVGEFWSPSGERFEKFVSRILQYASEDERLEFNRIYNFIREKKQSSQGEAK